MSPTRVYTRPSGLPEAVKWCSYCGSAFHKSTRHYCAKSGGVAPASTAPVAKAVGKYRAAPTHVDGIRFASKTEAALYEWAKSPCRVIVPHVRFPLHCLTSPGMPAAWFTPDLVIFGIGQERGEVQAWEAKGAKACESRDYQLRARAFRMTYPSIPLRVFRREGGRFVEDGAAISALQARDGREV